VYFLLAIQNTANRYVSNAFDLIGVFISFPLVRAAAVFFKRLTNRPIKSHAPAMTPFR
jgi:hypothetical protein